MFSLLTLLDDIATTFDDVAVMTKLAVKKTSAIMSDDLAVNAGVVHGTPVDRELPIVKKIFLGSLLNKVYCVSAVLLLTAIYPPILKVILLIGGLYLCFEGGHKLIEKLFHKKKKTDEVKTELAPQGMSEEDRIKGAVRTDLVLSMEIVVIAKEALSGSFLNQSISLVIVSIAASVLIYGLVALLIKMDDFGLLLIEKNLKRTGLVLVESMPYIMKGLGIVGTLAMFLVGGSIVLHTFHLSYILPEMVQNLLVGLIVGLALCLPLEIYNRTRKTKDS